MFIAGLFVGIAISGAIVLNWIFSKFGKNDNDNGENY